MIELLGSNVLGESSQGGGGNSKKYNLTMNCIVGDVDSNGVLQVPTAKEDAIFTGVKKISEKALYYKFYKASLKDVEFPDLEEITETQSCSYTFAESTVETVSFPKLKKIDGNQPCASMFYMCGNLTSVSFPELEELGSSNCVRQMFSSTAIEEVSFPKLIKLASSSMNGMFSYANSLRTLRFDALKSLSNSDSVVFNQTKNLNVYFPSLETIDVDAFKFSGTGATNLTYHFKAGMESVVQGLTNYPLFNATSGNLTIVYDL